MNLTSFDAKNHYILTFQNQKTTLRAGDTIVLERHERKKWHTPCSIFIIRTQNDEGTIVKINDVDGLLFENFNLDRFLGLITLLACSHGLKITPATIPGENLTAYTFESDSPSPDTPGLAQKDKTC